MGQVTGILKVKLGGDYLRIKDGTGAIDIGGKTRTPIMANGKIAGYTEKAVPARVEATMVNMFGDKLREISETVDETVEVETDTGETWLVANAFCENPTKVQAGEGDTPVVFIGDPAEKVG